jgi:hypothetical protein
LWHRRLPIPGQRPERHSCGFRPGGYHLGFFIRCKSGLKDSRSPAAGSLQRRHDSEAEAPPLLK